MPNESRNTLIIFNLCFLALIASLAMLLAIKGYPEKIFYLTSYVAVIYSVVHIYKNPRSLLENKALLCLLVSLLLFGASKLIWAELFHNTHFTDIRDNYHTVGKRFLLAAFVLFYFYQCRTLLHKDVLKLGVVMLFIGLFAALWLGYASRPTLEDSRVKWTTDAATTGAYVAVIICMAAAVLVRKCFQASKVSVALFLAIFIINMAMVLMTETRAAILFTPVLYIAFFLTYYRHISKHIQAMLAAVMLAGAALVLYGTWDRVAQIQTDIAQYHTNNDTSIGSRFSIWKSGWYSVAPRFLGQNPDLRYQKVEEYVNRYERGNPEASRNLAYHLHNDMLETLSLQGIFGLLALLCFYLSGLWFSLKKSVISNSGTFFVMAPIVVFGITDVVLIQSHTALVVVMTMALSLPALRQKA
ncbi:O-antigen ligase family protein [Gibbsiella dentisursi]|uniref:O-antigen ligase family protein n=1 Tax=Gibbsiella dentisursi TaxID=796890 RepID=A0ABP7M7H8_9GAMM